MTHRKQHLVGGDDDRPGAIQLASASETAFDTGRIASELGRRGGLKGGRARAAQMTPQERSLAARRAANARWHPQAKERLAAHDHAAHLYSSAADRLEQIAEFLHAGLTAGDRCLYVADEAVLTGILRALERRSVNVDAVVASGQLRLLTTDKVYVRDGEFDPMHTSLFWSEFLRSAQEDGASGLRAAADMGWVAEVGMTPRDLRDYETSINTSTLIASGARTICQFDRQQFTPAAFHAVLQTHRVVLLDGTARVNPFFEPPDVIDRGAEDDVRLNWMMDSLRESSPPAHSKR